jgi:hypothetical protein
MWRRQDVDFVDTRALRWDPVPDGELGSNTGGSLRKTLSRDRDDGAQTDLLAFCNPQGGVLEHDCDFYVLEGRGRVCDEPYAPGTYVHVTAGGKPSWVPEVGRTVVFAGHFGPPRVGAGSGSGVVTVKPWSRDEWVSMNWRGDESQPADVRIRWLRQDTSGTVFLAGMLPGYQAPLQETHPVYEESFKIAGDLLLGRRGVVTAGGYFFRSPGTWHGPLYTRTGNLSIIRKNGLGSTDYRTPPPGEDLEALVPRMYDGGLPAAALA